MPCDLAAIYDAHAPALFGFLLNFTRSEADTRDVLQELFLLLASRPVPLAGVRDPRGYLIRLAHHLAIDAHRSRASRSATMERAGEERGQFFLPSADPDEHAFRNALSDALAALPPEQRAVVHLKLWEGRTFAEIAELLDIPPNTAASRYRYGIDKLQGLLRPIYEELQ